MSLTLRIVLIFCAYCSLSFSIFAEETDQFTLPPVTLFDMGPGASERIYAELETIIQKANSDIDRLTPRSKTSKYAASQLALRRSGKHLAHLFYQKTGAGYPRWLRNVPKQSQPLQYREILPWKTVYWLAFSQSPLSFISLTPTINMYDHYFGTDKLGHIFLQGYTYYLIYNFCIKHGKSPEQARAIIVTYGQISEQSYLGTLVNGVYSNADLAGNYAGWKFYMNFDHSITLGERLLPPLLTLNKGHWEFTKTVTKDKLLEPFITDSLNEALNPSRYLFSRSQIRRQVKKRCADWIAKKKISPEIIESKLKEVRLWYGEPYGYWLPPKNSVTLASCF